jgi:hypothetical protein
VTVQQLVKGKWTSLRSASIKRQRLPNGKTTIGYVVVITEARNGMYQFCVSRAASSTNAGGPSGPVTVRVT